jgi:hypothetical protein
MTGTRVGGKPDPHRARIRMEAGRIRSMWSVDYLNAGVAADSLLTIIPR